MSARRKQHATPKKEKYEYEKLKKQFRQLHRETGFERARRQAQWHVYTTMRATHTNTEKIINKFKKIYIVADFTRLTRTTS